MADVSGGIFAGQMEGMEVRLSGFPTDDEASYSFLRERLFQGGYTFFARREIA